jgi:hypothetical protein
MKAPAEAATSKTAPLRNSQALPSMPLRINRSATTQRRASVAKTTRETCVA